MVISGVFEGLAAILIALVGAAVIFGQLKENAKTNKEAIEEIKDMVVKGQEDMKGLLSQSINDMKEMLNKEKNNSREALQNEIAHLRELVNINASETRADIQRLQQEQKESNNLKTKVALISSSVKALHHRLDLDPPTLLEDED